MYKIKTTQSYDDWFASLKDVQGKARIQARLRRVELGNLGDYKAINSDVAELRFFFGAGYRIYFTQQDGEIIILLAGGDKATQTKDINKALNLVKQLRGEL